MCNSERDGGRRCAAHTRPAYVAAAQALAAAPASPAAQDAALAAATEHASTPSGAEQIRADAADADRSGDIVRSAVLGSALRRGQARRDAAADISAASSNRKARVTETLRYGFAGHDYDLGPADFPQTHTPGPVELAHLPASALTATQEHLNSKPDMAKARGGQGRRGGPVDVVEHPDGRLCIRDGHHRASAWAAAGQDVPCRIERLPAG